MVKGEKCQSCAHNAARHEGKLDCEFACGGATRTKEDDDGVVYVTACQDYKRARKCS